MRDSGTNRVTEGHRSRNPEGSIAVFAVQEDGTLEVVGHAGSGGGTPRNMALHPGGEWAIVANQHSDNLVVFAVDPASGMLSKTGEVGGIEGPVCVAFADPRAAPAL